MDERICDQIQIRDVCIQDLEADKLVVIFISETTEPLK